MEIKIFCMNCREEILIADTDTLRTPLVGSMFKVKEAMEWDMYFSEHSEGKDLCCPLCEWNFHEEGRLSVPVNGDFVIGKPEAIIPGIIACSMNNPKLYGGIKGGGMAETIEFKGGLVPESHRPHKDAKSIAMDKSLDTVNAMIEKKGINTVASFKPSNELQELDKKITATAAQDKTPALEALQEIVEGKKQEPEKTEQPKDGELREMPPLNKGDWNKSQKTDEKSELDGKAPPGTTAMEPLAIKKKTVRRKAKKAKRRARKR